MASETGNGLQTTELRVRISENSRGDMDVEWAAFIKGTEVAISLRASHVAGQLLAASTVVASKAYAQISGDLRDESTQAPPAASNSTKEKKKKRR